jgi:hypothetical protein
MTSGNELLYIYLCKFSGCRKGYFGFCEGLYAPITHLHYHSDCTHFWTLSPGSFLAIGLDGVPVLPLWGVALYW